MGPLIKCPWGSELLAFPHLLFTLTPDRALTLELLIRSSKELSSTSTRVTNYPARVFLTPDLKLCPNARHRGGGGFIRMRSQMVKWQLSSQFFPHRVSFPPQLPHLTD